MGALPEVMEGVGEGAHGVARQGGPPPDECRTRKVCEVPPDAGGEHELAPCAVVLAVLGRGEGACLQPEGLELQR